MDDPGPVLLPARGDSDEPVDERSTRVARPGMDDDSGRLLDDEQVLVFVRGPEVDLLRLQRRGCGRWKVDLELFPTLQTMALRLYCAVDEYRAALEQALGQRARADLRQLREKAVEAVARRLVRNAVVRRLERAAAARASAVAAEARRGGQGPRGR